MHRIDKLILIFALLISIAGFSQQKYTLSGIIKEASSNEALIGVTVYFPELYTGVSTNEYGFYSITLPAGEHTIRISYLGFQDIARQIDLKDNLRIDFNLEEMVQELYEIVIKGRGEKINIRSPQMSVSRLSLETIKNVPVVFGESDVIKSILLLPGVTNTGEASTGFNVRGGATDQNLVLLDEATIFNSSHLFGFFSVFNPDAIKDVKLYKGAIPARFGGRISSVLDIFQKEGNSKDLKVSGGIGTVAGRLLVEGPIVENRSSFLAGGRISYGHFLLPLFNVLNSANFYDLNAKFSHRINEENKIYLSGYFGRDRFTLNENYTNNYGNSIINFRWNNLISDKKFSNLAVLYSNYYFELDQHLLNSIWTSHINHLNVKYDIESYKNEKYQINYGINNIYYQFDPGKVISSDSDSGVSEKQLIKKNAYELAFYFDIEHYISSRLSMQYGVRLGMFLRLPQEKIYRYRYNQPVVYDPFLLTYLEADTLEFVDSTPATGFSDPDKTGISEIFTNPEPRISASYRINMNNSIKASYNRIAQYIHLLSNTNSPTPIDVWTPSGKYIEPQLVNQFSLGYFRRSANGQFSFETESFFKHVKNRIDYIDGADLIANDAIERVILLGEARAYGIEALLRKSEGKLKGWISYTLSKSEQRTPGRKPVRDTGRSNKETGINLGKWYNTPFDKTHDIAVYGSFEPSKKWKFNFDFIYQTGQPTNYPLGQFEFQGLSIPYYGLRNKERLPEYHRLDLSISFTPLKKASSNWESEWIFSVYNVYNRMNAASINFRRNYETGVNEAVRISIFGVVPSLTYNFKF